MASLLDVIVARRNPQLAGLLGVPAEQPASAGLLSRGGQQPPAAPQPGGGGGGGGGGGIGGALGRIFTGPNDPELSPEANAQARQQALLQAGLATLAGGAGGARGIQRLAQGALVGQSLGAQARERALQRQEQQEAEEQLQRTQQQVTRALASEDFDKIQQIQGQLALAGQTEAASALGSILETQGVGAESIKVDLNNGRTAMVNPITNQVEAEFGVPDKQEVERVDLGDRVIFHVKGEPDNIVAVEQKGVSPDKAAQIAFEREKEARRQALQAAGIVTEEQSKLMNTLADDIRQDAKDSQFVADAARTLNNMPGNAASDLSLVMALTRITDPGASVRQSDVENATNIGGLSAITQQWINRLKSEGEFSTTQRRLLREEAKRIARERREAWQGRLGKFRERAEMQGLPDPAIETIAIDPFAGLDLSPNTEAEAAEGETVEERLLNASRAGN